MIKKLKENGLGAQITADMENHFSIVLSHYLNFVNKVRQIPNVPKKYKLKMPGGWYGSLLRGRSANDEWAAMQDHLNLLKMVKADVFVFADVSGSIQGDQTRKLSTRPKMDDDEFGEYCKKINEISNRLYNEGIPMSYHEHMGTIIQTEHDVDRFMENTNNNTFLLYDTGHLLFAQADYERILKNYVSKINHVHCKDLSLIHI